MSFLDIGHYVQLEMRGEHYMGLCPFHRERTPSFTVDFASGTFHCFGCGVSGDAAEFSALVERLKCQRLT